MVTRTLFASLALVLSTGGIGLAAPAAAQSTFTNPLLQSGPDPWITRDGDTYYYMHTLGNRIAIWKTQDISRLAEATPQTVWTPPATGPNAEAIWAPELHRIGGKWYLYYTAAAKGQNNDAHRGVFVLENASADPLQGEWIDRGRVNTASAGIDGTVFEHESQLYFVYSPYVGPDSVLSIARMSNPWTLSTPETIIARPDLEWERQGGRQILEGPEFLKGPQGGLFMTYSASACWSDDYALGLLSAPAGSNLLDARSWTKTPEPVLKKGNGVYATGHNGFFTSPDGTETWIIYHGNPAPNMQCTQQRAPHIKRIEWDAQGRPVFGSPTPIGQPVPVPSR